MRLLGSLGLVLLLCTGCTTPQSDPFAEPTADRETAAAPEPQAASPTEPPVIPAINLSGSGKSATQKFSLEGGLTIFEMTHQGSSNFAAQLLSGSSGELVELLANVIGNYSGSKVVGVENGEYAIDVEADGPWTITVKQPRPTKGSVTSPVSGSGPKAVGPISFDGGLETFKLQHSGQSNFAVQLLDNDGELQELLANEIGSFSGSKAAGVSAGIYWFDVEADGTWSVAWQDGVD